MLVFYSKCDFKFQGFGSFDFKSDRIKDIIKLLTIIRKMKV